MKEQRLQQIQQCLQTALQPTVIELTDDSDRHQGHAGAQTGQGHFVLKIASPAFEGQSLLTCHRMIYKVLNKLMQTDIHALTIHII